MVDLTRDHNGQVRARLLDLILSRSGPAYVGWLAAHVPGVDHLRRAWPVPRLRQRAARLVVGRGAGFGRLPGVLGAGGARVDAPHDGRPVSCSALRRLVNAVNFTSATSASMIQRCSSVS